MSLDLSDEEAAVLERLLRDTIDARRPQRKRAHGRRQNTL
jgi:hypothetical protein